MPRRRKRPRNWCKPCGNATAGRVQCIVMVRDDFWMAVTRFMRELGDSTRRRRRTLRLSIFSTTTMPGKCWRRSAGPSADFPRAAAKTSKEQKEFLETGGAGLAQDGKVICVRLALFAEMMKGKPWTPATLKEVGGTEGVGVTFLEETFSAATAPPEHRYHQKAARAVLKALLPESGTDIKGHMRSYAELLEASGYAESPQGLR